MKAKAPDKIYIQCFNVSEEDAKFDKSKMFFDDVWTEKPELGQENIEYVHKDAFIEKACDWLEPVLKNYAGYYVGEDILGDFRKYMEGE